MRGHGFELNSLRQSGTDKGAGLLLKTVPLHE